jgi:hyperosmotically inducible periplasmic protein
MRTKRVAILFLAALSAVALAAGCSNTQKDQAIATDIKAKMFSDPQVKAANVDVAVKDGEATLSGEVPDDGARYQAFKLATDTPGVKHVVDKMTVQTAQAAPAAESAPAEPPPTPKPLRKVP